MKTNYNELLDIQNIKVIVFKRDGEKRDLVSANSLSRYENIYSKNKNVL